VAGNRLNFPLVCRKSTIEEEEERNNEMLQWLARKLDSKDAEKFLSEMNNKYPKNDILLLHILLMHFIINNTARKKAYGIWRR
jgi:hypothetical protein